MLYEKDGQYALTFVGTDKWSYKDHGANLKMAATGDSQQIQEAKKFASNMKDKYGLTPDNTVSIGHSEGGTEATVVGVDNEFKTVTFNAYGVGSKQIEKGKNYDTLVTNYRDAHDPVSKLHGNIGTTYITPSTQSTFMSKTPFGSIQSHGIGNMGDCERAVPVDQYKKSNPMFLDKISDTDISRKDIADMDSNLFKVYEKEIDTRVANNQIKQNDNSGSSIEKSTTSSGKSSSSTSSSSSSDGKWVTINGNHVLIKD